MNTLKLFSICIIAATVCLVSCTKQELQREDETSCVKSDFALEPSNNETYPLTLAPDDYPFQYAINQNDTDEFFYMLHNYLTFNSQNVCVIMSMDNYEQLLRYGIYDGLFNLEQVYGDTIYFENEVEQTLCVRVLVRVGSKFSHNYNDVKDWAHQKMAEGCTVIIQYNRNTGEYGAIAYVCVEAEEEN